jgi:hypothetical protein
MKDNKELEELKYNYFYNWNKLMDDRLESQGKTWDDIIPKYEELKKALDSLKSKEIIKLRRRLT